ncbi:MAG: hypothetical protein IIC73_01870 [Armatimonadetes bacterium]|nr:hypothetical protein [Armatimonadota bacterium]
MNVAVIGTGYVGLPTGVVLADLGHDVVCIDIDKDLTGWICQRRRSREANSCLGSRSDVCILLKSFVVVNCLPGFQILFQVVVQN